MKWSQIIDAIVYLKYVFPIIAAIILLIGAYHGLNWYLDHRITTKINDADFLKKLARSVRPSLVFDQNGSIIADMRAVSYINNISISEGPKDSFTIVVSPVDFLAVEPVLEPLDGRYNIHGQRGKKFDWVFNLSGISTLLLEDSPLSTREKQRFRLEIIR
jgi:hypothetical protein